jgi:signal transduction histidine kinase
MLDALKASRDELESAYQEIIHQNALAEVGKFSLMIAHEVKNPLGIIKSSLDVLKGDADISKNDTVIYYMEDEIRRLNMLIEDFLSFARPGRPCFRPVDVSGLLGEMVEKFEIQKGGAGVEIHSHIETDLHHDRMDPDIFARAVANILKNAFEANGDRGEVRLTAVREDDTIRVDIEDQGNGIDKAVMHRIFEPFYTTRSKGTGLGLAYAQQVVTVHKGSITAHNRNGGGACFRIEIPLAHGSSSA